MVKAKLVCSMNAEVTILFQIEYYDKQKYCIAMTVRKFNIIAQKLKKNWLQTSLYAFSFISILIIVCN